MQPLLLLSEFAHSESGLDYISLAKTTCTAAVNKPIIKFIVYSQAVPSSAYMYNYYIEVLLLYYMHNSIIKCKICRNELEAR